MDVLPSTELARAWRDWRPRRDGKPALTWGLPWLERSLPPPPPGSLVVFGADPGVGKSFLMLAMLSAAARGASSRPSLYISLEDPELEVGRRVAHGDLAHERLFVSVPEVTRSSDIVRTIEEAGRAGIGWVGVDYLQLVDYDGGVQAWSEERTVAQTVKELKLATRAAGVGLVLASQLRKPTLDESRGFPSPHRLKGSGAILAAAEVVIMLGANTRGLKARASKVKSGQGGSEQRYARGPGGVLVPTEGSEEGTEEHGKRNED